MQKAFALYQFIISSSYPCHFPRFCPRSRVARLPASRVAGFLVRPSFDKSPILVGASSLHYHKLRAASTNQQQRLQRRSKQRGLPYCGALSCLSRRRCCVCYKFNFLGVAHFQLACLFLFAGARFWKKPPSSLSSEGQKKKCCSLLVASWTIHLSIPEFAALIDIDTASAFSSSSTLRIDHLYQCLHRCVAEKTLNARSLSLRYRRGRHRSPPRTQPGQSRPHLHRRPKGRRPSHPKMQRHRFLRHPGPRDCPLWLHRLGHQEGVQETVAVDAPRQKWPRARRRGLQDGQPRVWHPRRQGEEGEV